VVLSGILGRAVSLFQNVISSIFAVSMVGRVVKINIDCE
jgi:hypothetical protein